MKTARSMERFFSGGYQLPTFFRLRSTSFRQSFPPMVCFVKSLLLSESSSQLRRSFGLISWPTICILCCTREILRQQKGVVRYIPVIDGMQTCAHVMLPQVEISFALLPCNCMGNCIRHSHCRGRLQACGQQ